MSQHTSDYDFTLPEHLIARHPCARRDGARMLVVHRDSGTWEHRSVADFASYLEPDELVILNNARVLPARFVSDDGLYDFLLLEGFGSNLWRCLAKPGRKLRPGVEVMVDGHRAVVDRIDPSDGSRWLAWDAPPDLQKIGHMPLPPYMDREDTADDRERYQTVFAEKPGAIAAPTAGLHFTREMLAAIPHAFVTLYVGIGTFRPVKSEVITDHLMHQERFEIESSTAAAINAARSICAVGTTCVRVLEGCKRSEDGLVLPQQGETAIFLHPPKTIPHVQRLLTNFHLPKSTLMMLISAFAGRELMLEAYAEAIREEYRFFSYGDCMLLV